jgi:hypothetical protein
MNNPYFENAKKLLGASATDEQVELKVKELETQFVLEQKQKAFNQAIQTHLDGKAKEYRYDNIMSARSYAGYDNPFQTEAQKLAVWASNCWVKAGEIEADVQSGNRDMPTIDEVLAELPVYE